MDKNAIKKYAVWARRELIERVSQRAMIYGITAKDAGDPNAESVNGHLLSQAEKRQRQALIRNIKTKGYEQVMEEVAYTWFNRFAALRFMEVNGYLPSHIRVFTNDAGEFKPQILAEAIHLELDGLDMNKVYDLESANKSEELFKYLLIVQCNALNSILPGMFQRIDDYTELLLPDYLLREGSVIEQMVTTIPEEDWTDQVQIIGWLYQYYNTELKDKVFADLKKNIKITKENIPAATQLFTPDWIVHYMVENSLGRLWLEGHPNDTLKSEWKYYLDEAEQEPEVQAQLAAIRKEYAALKPEEIRVIDPCMGSGHILCVLFDILVRIYEDYGYTAREAAGKIAENNLWGLDIDDRASQLAYFSVMMKARQYDRRFFTRGIQPHVYAIVESNGLDEHVLEYFVNGRPELQHALDSLITDLHDAKEYGAILNVTSVDFAELFSRIEEIQNESELNLHSTLAVESILPLIQVGQTMAQLYQTVVTNPPYMGFNGMGRVLSAFLRENYPNCKNDIYAACMKRFLQMVTPNGFESIITMESWMFLTSFEKIRSEITENNTICTLVHMPYLGKGGTSLGINFGTDMAVIRKGHIKNFLGMYDRIAYYETNEDGIPFVFPVENTYYGSACQDNFAIIPGSPIAYWKSGRILRTFSGESLDDKLTFRQGMTTTDNEKYLRLWFEVSMNSIGFNVYSREASIVSKKKWFPYQKGGEYRKWYGNNSYVVFYLDDGIEMVELVRKKYPRISDPEFIIKNRNWYFKEGLTWSTLSTGSFGVRFVPAGFIFDAKGSMAFTKDKGSILCYIALLNSSIIANYLDVLAPTMDYNIIALKAIPYLMEGGYWEEVESRAKKCIDIAKKDWNCFENSWEFKHHPLIRKNTISEAFAEWEEECAARFSNLKNTEEELNRIFIEIYGLKDEVNPDVEDSEVTVRNADLQRDVRSLISYAVGCMLGRFSLDEDGLAYAGGKWNPDKYKTFPADSDGILPICDDEYFEDDIVGRFVKFIKVVYGEATLEENLRFIADVLGGKGSARDVIRNYFINDFYADHCSMYSVTGSGKRPIYWLFDSGKKNGFKCLIYMHRYQPDTIARIRTDYVHEQQSRYRTAIADLEQRISGASTSERVKLSKQLATLQAQAEEIRVYEEKIHHLADQMIKIDLDDGVKHNYEIFKDVLAKI